MLQICLYVKGCQVLQLTKNANINTTISFVHDNICQKDHQTIIRTMIITIIITLIVGIVLHKATTGSCNHYRPFVTTTLLPPSIDREYSQSDQSIPV